MGRTDMEDALMRLDRDARMAAAQVREVTNTVDDRGGFLITILSVDNRVAYIDDRVMTK